MHNRFPSPMKVLVELLFVVSVIMICMGSAFGKLDEFVGHPILASRHFLRRGIPLVSVPGNITTLCKCRLQYAGSPREGPSSHRGDLLYPKSEPLFLAEETKQGGNR